ncbi:hydroxymethylbilane synthase [Roseomonas marmotae]|uniref:Porphobilinogen deaminase n=1 Tax=Roseomonas marmotae TaxID=2768161 RepID=A0ABS3KFR6_9PROT|nr:hydroxymethylbilane synthase [Roseomonas marmotae]MBO1076290.1 hydroxymethylbilane synthase [Roseomonas marmotae]QTI77832.1 hydroxymethylbilane synthase [Roseomonas marmotae]
MSAVLSPPPLPRHPAARPAALRLGTRGSALARVQAGMAAAALAGLRPDVPLRETVIATAGDQVQDRLLADFGGKGLFAKEIHEALLDGRVDLAVHSLKDLETELPAGISIACVLPREDPRDALVLAPCCPLAERALPFPVLPEAGRIGTASARRQAQLLHARPDLRMGLMRGNLRTRLQRLESGDFVATLLAVAGLKRLGLTERIAMVLEPEVMLPAAGQGILAVTARSGDHRMRALLAQLDDPAARVAAEAERAVLRALDGSCHTPIGAFARMLPGNELLLTGMVARGDGAFVLRRQLRGARTDAGRLGAELGAALRADTPRDILS